jgi:hypothetical protein
MSLDVRRDYVPQSPPFEHQWEALEQSISKKAFAFLMDPGLGKTKTTYDTGAILFERGHIRAIFILAPNDVHSQWIDEQLPLHLPHRIRARTLVWRSSNARVLRESKELLKPLPDRLVVVAMNSDAIATKRGKAFAKKLLTTYPTLFVLDESHEFKNPNASRTRAVLHLSHDSFARRILTGTFTDGNPFDIYAQFNFLNPRILDCDSFLAFKRRYAVMEQEFTRIIDKRTGKQRLVQYESVQEYRRLEELNARLAPFVYRRRKEDCADLPPKTYVRVPTHLSEKQKIVYHELLETGLVLLKQSEEGKRGIQVQKLEELTDEDLADRIQSAKDRVSFQIKLTLFLKLQQCVAGYLKTDEGKEIWIDGEDYTKCPRIATTVEYVRSMLASTRGKIIVWCNFRRPLRALSDVLHEQDVGHVMIDGTVTGAVRTEAIRVFKDSSSDIRVMLAHPKTMGTGQNLAVAQTVIYYTRSLSFIQRRQSEDRVHRIGQTGSVIIADMMATDAPSDCIELALLKEKEAMADRLQTFNSERLAEMLTL